MAEGAGSMNGAVAPAVPEGWPRATTPRHVLVLGWARLAAQQWEGSGYNWAASELSRGLVLSGHRVSYLRSGMTYRPWGGPRIKPFETWGGVACFELINSPNLAPSAFNFANIRQETASPACSAMIASWAASMGVDVVHAHSLEGYGLDLIAALDDAGIPVVVTAHNYWFVCPQVDLLHKEREVCVDYDGGRRCVGCLPRQDTASVKRTRGVGQWLESSIGMYRADVVRKTIYGVKPVLKKLAGKGGGDGDESDDKYRMPDWHGDPEVGVGLEPGAQPVIVEPKPTGIVKDTDAGKDYTPSAWDQNEQVLEAARTTSLTVLNDYGTRRQVGVSSLNRAAMLIPPSDFLRRVHVEMGVEDARTRWVRLGLPHFDRMNRRAKRSRYYDTPPWDAATARRPLRVAFFGTTRPNKGLEVLVRAIPLIDPEALARTHIAIRAMGDDASFRRRLAHFPQVTVQGGFDVMQLASLAGSYDVAVMPHIWMENSPLVMLEHLHAGKMIISSRLGGPPDWLREGENAFLFAAGDEQALARIIAEVARGEKPLRSPRQVHEASTLQSYPAHVAEVSAIYDEVLQHAARASSAR